MRQQTQRKFKCHLNHSSLDLHPTMPSWHSHHWGHYYASECIFGVTQEYSPFSKSNIVSSTHRHTITALFAYVYSLQDLPQTMPSWHSHHWGHYYASECIFGVAHEYGTLDSKSNIVSSTHRHTITALFAYVNSLLDLRQTMPSWHNHHWGHYYASECIFGVAHEYGTLDSTIKHKNTALNFSMCQKQCPVNIAITEVIIMLQSIMQCPVKIAITEVIIMLQSIMQCPVEIAAITEVIIMLESIMQCPF